MLVDRSAEVSVARSAELAGRVAMSYQQERRTESDPNTHMSIFALKGTPSLAGKFEPRFFRTPELYGSVGLNIPAKRYDDRV